ncbi:MAG: hypothetical protein HY294_13095 [Candidatus Rokubacteria bacterium]|nr:hypothetical protein [Candidatus Rokubacteria bacterium]MBI3826929.1 hypothetical protein [Candidatus Rokubacteria bacterium]
MPGDAGTFPHSQASGPPQNERAPRFLGTTRLLILDHPGTTFEFIDAPAPIAIDNLHVTSPEPSMGVLLALGGAALAALRLRLRGRRARSRAFARRGISPFGSPPRRRLTSH